MYIYLPWQYLPYMVLGSLIVNDFMPDSTQPI